MPATLIKIVTGSIIQEFPPSAIVKISANSKSSEIVIALTGGEKVVYVTPSPMDAMARLSSLETAIDSGTGIVTLTDTPLSLTTSTTTVGG